MTDVYRHAASVLVLRPAGSGGYEFLLLHKPRKRDAWQLPQGGVEAGESIEQAALRELMEEASMQGCQVIGQSADLYEYDFPTSFRRFRPDNVKGQKIGFIFALAPADARVRVDNNEIDGHVWIRLPELGKFIQRKEYTDLVERLYAEAMRELAKC